MSDRGIDFAVVTLFPEMFGALTDWGVTGRAYRQGLWHLSLHNPRDHATDRHGSVDDRPYGGGPGMVMTAPVLDAALTEARQALGGACTVVAATPQGEPFSTAVAAELLCCDRVAIVAGRYEGMDERFLQRSVDREISLGDYVVSGGELPAMLMMDAMIRQLPDALGHEASAVEESFVDGLLDWPHYTRPEVYEGVAVPAVLLSGDHSAIASWRRAQAVRRTLDRRPDLLDKNALGTDDLEILKDWKLD
ncbi:MAG: tRNA (guanosine(37)-N1)-methyltransferase TrmD [Cellvibrionales bacterium]|jgi:tRNA (guanine37-N1)-methyltransferase